VIGIILDKGSWKKRGKREASHPGQANQNQAPARLS